MFRLSFLDKKGETQIFEPKFVSRKKRTIWTVTAWRNGAQLLTLNKSIWKRSRRYLSYEI